MGREWRPALEALSPQARRRTMSRTGRGGENHTIDPGVTDEPTGTAPGDTPGDADGRGQGRRGLPRDRVTGAGRGLGVAVVAPTGHRRGPSAGVPAGPGRPGPGPAVGPAAGRGGVFRRWPRDRRPLPRPGDRRGGRGL